MLCSDSDLPSQTLKKEHFPVRSGQTEHAELKEKWIFTFKFSPKYMYAKLTVGKYQQ